MSHYSDDYEYQAEKARKLKRERYKALLEKLNDFDHELHFIGKDFPDRFKHSLEDFKNWLEVHSKE